MQKTFTLGNKEARELLHVLLETSGLLKDLSPADKDALINETLNTLDKNNITLNRDNIKSSNMQARLTTALVTTFIEQVNRPDNAKFAFRLFQPTPPQLAKRLKRDHALTDPKEEPGIDKQLEDQLRIALEKLLKLQPKPTAAKPNQPVKPAPQRQEDTEMAGIFDDAGNLVLSLGFFQNKTSRLTIDEILANNSGNTAEQEEETLHARINNALHRLDTPRLTM